MQQVALDKKSNMEFLEKEVGLKRFFPKNLTETYKVTEFILLMSTYFKGLPKPMIRAY